MPVLCVWAPHQCVRAAGRLGGRGRVIILLCKPRRLGSSVCHRLERRVEGPLKTGGLRIYGNWIKFWKMAPNLHAPHPSSPSLTFHSLPPTARGSASLVNNLIKNWDGRNMKCSGPLCTDTCKHMIARWRTNITKYVALRQQAMELEFGDIVFSGAFLQVPDDMRWSSWNTCMRLFM